MPCEPVILTEDHDQSLLFLKSISSIRYIMPTDMGMSEIRDGLSLISDTGFSLARLCQCVAAELGTRLIVNFLENHAVTPKHTQMFQGQPCIRRL